MRKFIGGVIIAVLLFLAISNFTNISERVNKRAKADEYNKIMKVDYDEDYPVKAEDVIDQYIRIEKLIYNSNFVQTDEKKFTDLLNLQLEFYHKEFIEGNGGAELINIKSRGDIEKFIEKEYKILSYEVQPNPQKIYDERDGKEIKNVFVREIMNKGDSSCKTYALKRDESGKWKIITFAFTEQW